jgi:hypothetical protein
LFLLTCGVLEGAGEQSVALLKELMARGARVENCVGSRPNHGKRLAPLCLALAHLERFADPGEPEPDTGKGGFFGADALLRGLGIVPGDGDDALGSEDASSETSSTSFFGASRSDARAWRKTRVANDASDPGTPRSVARFGSEGSESGAEETESLTNEEKTPKLDTGGIEEDAKEAPFRGSGEAEMDDLVAEEFRPARLRDVKNAITALIAGGADVNARCRLGAFKDGRNETLAAPFRSVCAYRGVAGTRRRRSVPRRRRGDVAGDAFRDALGVRRRRGSFDRIRRRPRGAGDEAWVGVPVRREPRAAGDGVGGDGTRRVRVERRVPRYSRP